jgi:hypothetical protein
LKKVISNQLPVISLIAFCLFFLSSCKIYNFTGSSIAPDIKTISIDNVINETGQGPPRMAQDFTERLKDYFQSNTSLRVVRSNADLSLQGAIIGYSLSPLAPGASQTGTKNRLTITLRIDFENTKDSTQNIKALSLMNYGDDWDASTPFTSVEASEIEVILQKFLLDVFQKTTAQW